MSKNMVDRSLSEKNNVTIHKNDTDEIQMMSTTGEFYSLPSKFRFGDCRPLSNFVNISYTGEGSQGVVYKAKDTVTEDVVVLKKLKMIEKDYEGISINHIHELQVLNLVDHKNVIKLLSVAVGKRFISAYMVFEYCPYSLANLIDSGKDNCRLQEPQIKCILHQIFNGLKYLHCRGVLHRDLSCSNILFREDGVLKIIDFGCSRLQSTKEMSPNLVSLWYRAPELLFGATHYTNAIDMWPAGCIFAELILKKPLFKAASVNTMITLIIELLGTPTEEIWPGVENLPLLQLYELHQQPHNYLHEYFKEESICSINLLQSLLIFNPTQRITAENALLHSYFLSNPLECDLKSLVEVLNLTEELL